jgi:hypothetical protein
LISDRIWTFVFVGVAVGRIYDLEIFDHETYNSSRRECDDD